MGRGTLLFVDEIHRFNRSQQDSFLPVVEDGTVVLVGATTENPSFELNGALLSRCQVLVLRRLDDAALEALLQRAEAHYGEPLKLDADARATLRAMADGDGRYMLNLAEEVANLRTVKPLDPAGLMAAVQRRMPLYDKSREEHYNLISALHKSVRGSDPDAALYWLARMLAAWCAWRLKTFRWPTRKRCIRRWPPRTSMNSSVRPKASWRWRNASSISPPRRNRTRSIGPSRPPSARRRSMAR
jgi:putative ATPase